MNDAPALRDIHAPPPPDWWPPAPGWWLVAFLSLIVLVILARWVWRWYRGWRRRRSALKSLAALRAQFSKDGNAAGFAAAVSVLLRRVALMRFIRAEVAGLHGAAWLAFLDRTGGGGRFAGGPGKLLATAPYAPNPELNAETLHALAADWLKRNA